MRKPSRDKIDFSCVSDSVSIPYLLEVQRASYRNFLSRGIREHFESVFPIEPYGSSGDFCLEYVSSSLGTSKYTEEQCRINGATYAAPLRVKVKLHFAGEIREQEIYCGDVPLMTRNAGFIINGAERVIVTQLQRSAGISLEIRLLSNGKKSYFARLIPARGAWIEFEYSPNNIFYVSIDRRRKILATTFFKAIGFGSTADILKSFCEIDFVSCEKLTQDYIGLRLADRVVDPNTGEIIADCLDTFHSGLYEMLQGRKGVEIPFLKDSPISMAFVNTFAQGDLETDVEAAEEVYKRLRPGEPINPDTVVHSVIGLVNDSARYDLSKVGRYVLNKQLGVNVSGTMYQLTHEDFIATIQKLVLLNITGEADDIDHLGKRRVVLVGEQVQNQFYAGLVRMERLVQERLSTGQLDDDSTMPNSFLNFKFLATMIKDFFQRNQLSQFMDHVNPLALITHKRRLSSLGPGGLNRDRAGFEVRDVHHSHYGRICPIETPEGPNIGLIASLALFCRVNEYGFLETPYRKVIDGVVSDQIEYLAADLEDQYYIADANIVLSDDATFKDDTVVCRYRGDYYSVASQKIDYVDVSTKQIFSLATSLIPFLEHNDANRALMGANMQRQAVPLLNTDYPRVATGTEGYVAKDSGSAIFADTDGVVLYVDARKLIFESEYGVQTYNFVKYSRSNSGTCLVQKPVVSVGQKIKKGEVLADGQSTSMGQLALGRNVLVAFMSWRGYNFEDAILVNETLVRDEVYTSLKIEEFTVEARDTKLGEEEITRDIPNVSEDDLKNLDDNGVIKIGSKVKPGDIIVGKIAPSPKADLQSSGISSEERLLRVLFGEKILSEFRNVSLKATAGIEGTVIGCKIFEKRPTSSSADRKKKDKELLARVESLYQKDNEEIIRITLDKLQAIVGKKLVETLYNFSTGEEILVAGTEITAFHLESFLSVNIDQIKFEGDEELSQKVRSLLDVQQSRIQYNEESLNAKKNHILYGDDLGPGVLKVVRVYVACKRRLSVGDKMAGRHGNKGVVSKIVKEEDMPYLSDGTPVDFVLNSLGVPSRMNVGQILETHLGWAARLLDIDTVTPVFDGASIKDIKNLLVQCQEKYPNKDYVDSSGTVTLYDGRTGRPFDQRVTVGVMYILKLNHLIDDKVHARSIGPYSLVTQQPLGGKAQFGGQRFGEMEVWALEGYGAAYTLQELLTVKSDDVKGRNKIYQSIVKNEHILYSAVRGPESFNVLMRELRSLGLDVTLETSSEVE